MLIVLEGLAMSFWLKELEEDIRINENSSECLSTRRKL